jgi:hypothetical protein
MKLWGLRRAQELAVSFSEDASIKMQVKLLGCIVRAESDDQARELASLQEGAKSGYIWLDDKLTICVELEPLSVGKAEVVMTQWIASAA